MRKVKLFLASAKALGRARRDFEVMVGRRNQRGIDAGLFIDLVIWEDFLDALALGWPALRTI